MAPWGLFAAALGGAGLLWNGTSPPHLTAKPAVSDEAAAEEAGVNPTRLLVDFRDGISPEALRATGVPGAPFQRLLQGRRPLHHRLPDGRRGRRGARQAGADPDVESVDYDAVATIFPDEEVQEANAEAAEAASALARGGVQRQERRRRQDFPNDPRFKYQWHLQQIHMPDTWKAGRATASSSPSSTPAWPRSADLAETEFVPGYNFVTNNANATDDHGHGTHVAGTIAQSTNNGIGVAGVAFHAKIMPIKVLSARGSGSLGGIAEASAGRPITAPRSST